MGTDEGSCRFTEGPRVGDAVFKDTGWMRDIIIYLLYLFTNFLIPIILF